MANIIEIIDAQEDQDDEDDLGTGEAWARDADGRFVNASPAAELRRLLDRMWRPARLTAEQRSFGEVAQRRAMGYARAGRFIAGMHACEAAIRTAIEALNDGMRGEYDRASAKPHEEPGVPFEIFGDFEQQRECTQLLAEALGELSAAYMALTSAMRASTGPIRYRIDGLTSAEAISEAAQEAAFLRLCAEQGYDLQTRTTLLAASFGLYACRPYMTKIEYDRHRSKYRERTRADEERWQRWGGAQSDLVMLDSDKGPFPAWFVALHRGDLLEYQRQAGVAPRRAESGPLGPIDPAEALALSKRWTRMTEALRAAVQDIGQRTIREGTTIGAVAKQVNELRAEMQRIGESLLAHPVAAELAEAFLSCDIRRVASEFERFFNMADQHAAKPFLDPAPFRDALRRVYDALTEFAKAAGVTPEEFEPNNAQSGGAGSSHRRLRPQKSVQRILGPQNPTGQFHGFRHARARVHAVAMDRRTARRSTRQAYLPVDGCIPTDASPWQREEWLACRARHGLPNHVAMFVAKATIEPQHTSTAGGLADEGDTAEPPSVLSTTA